MGNISFVKRKCFESGYSAMPGLTNAAMRLRQVDLVLSIFIRSASWSWVGAKVKREVRYRVKKVLRDFTLLHCFLPFVSATVNQRIEELFFLRFETFADGIVLFLVGGWPSDSIDHVQVGIVQALRRDDGFLTAVVNIPCLFQVSKGVASRGASTDASHSRCFLLVNLLLVKVDAESS